MKTVAVVLAGGIGIRAGLGIPKQLIKIAGKSVVEHTLEVIQSCTKVDEIILMMNSKSILELNHLIEDSRFSKLSRILPGGETRNDTTQLALEAITNDEAKVLIHDAVRPFVDDRILNDCIDALDNFEAVDTAIPSADTIIHVGEDGCIDDMPNRAFLRRGQTPQAFKLSTIRRAYALARKDSNFSATDDCGVVFKYLPYTKIFVVAGSAENMKITEPIDIHIADKIFQLQTTRISSRGTTLPDLHGDVVVVFGGSYGIGASVVELCRSQGAEVLAFSRSATGTDVTSRKDVRRALTEAKESFGKLDHIIVTAGVLSISPLAETTKKQIKHTIRTNLTAPAIIAQESYASLADSRGSLTFFTSSSYTRGRAGYSLYSATKAGVVNMTQALAEEWSNEHIRVNCVNPQRTQTPMRTAAFGEEPSHTLLNAQDVAEATLRLMVSRMTGQVLDVRLHSPQQE